MCLFVTKVNSTLFFVLFVYIDHCCCLEHVDRCFNCRDVPSVPSCSGEPLLSDIQTQMGGVCRAKENIAIS